MKAGGVTPTVLQQLVFNLLAQLGVFYEHGADVLLALAQALAPEGEPGAALLDDLVLYAQVDELALAAHAGAVEDIHQGLAEGRRHLVLDHLDARAVAVGLFLIFKALDAANVYADTGVELERVAAGGRFRAAVAGHAYLHADLVDEHHHRAGLVDGAGELAQGVAHKPGLAAHLGLAHLALKFGLGNKRGDGVDDHEVHRVGAHQQVGDFKGLLAEVRLGNKQFLGLNAQAAGIGHVERVFGVDEGRRAAALLALGHQVQGQGRLAGGLRPVDFGDAALGDAAHAKGDVETDGAGGNHRDGDQGGAVVHAHDGPFAELALDGGQRCGERLLAKFFRAGDGLFGHG